MLCKLFNMNNTTYVTVPCLRSGYSPISQPKSTTMYSSWKAPEQVENIHPKLSGSWKKIGENLSENEDGGHYFDPQRNTKKSSREFGSDLKGEQGMSETSQESIERPQFQVTIEKPVGQFLNVGNWRHSRRASDGAIFAPNPSGRAERSFGVLAEEAVIHPVNLQVPARRSSTGPLSMTPLARNRRVSVDCISRVRKVSVVVPQPRNKENSGLRQIKSNENLSSISFDSEDTSWRELVAKAKGFRPSKSAETPIAHRANGGDFIVQARATNSPAEPDQVDGRNLTNRRSSDINSSDLDVKTNTAVVAIPSSSGLASDRSSAVAKESLSDSEDIKRAQIEVNDARKKSRRFSVATIRPTHSFAQTSAQKVSGYSTHGTLEYARQLLGKLQTEGRSKSKKERLDELSKALKWILEELNRIEVPDRDLVSLFISLRAKIVNLKAEVKAEERDLSSVDLESMGRMPQILTTSEDKPQNVYSRRFSWC